jgi:hypothetical protein
MQEVYTRAALRSTSENGGTCQRSYALLNVHGLEADE